mgnify:CR=1 FL=1
MRLERIVGTCMAVCWVLPGLASALLQPNPKAAHIRNSMLDPEGDIPSNISFDYTDLEVDLNVDSKGRLRYYQSELDGENINFVALAKDSEEWLAVKDSYAASRARDASRAISNLFLLFAVVISGAFIAFPGSFDTTDYSKRDSPMSILALFDADDSDYSESGGVVWPEDLEPMAKTTVDILP